MSLSCPNCDTAILDEELPRLDESAKVLCPQCHEPLTLPEMTIPLSIVNTPLDPARTALDPHKKYALLVLSGPEAGKVLDIDKETVSIGRSDCDLLLDDPEISRRHATVEIDGTTATVVDLGSTNGTFFDGERIERVTLHNRDKFRVGSHEVALVVTERDD